MSNQEEWRRWKAEVFDSEYMIWHDGLPIEKVQHLAGDERENAIRMLRIGVDVGDSHATQALAAMGETSATTEMRDQLRQASSGDKVRVALAIHALEPDESLASELIEVLKTPPWSQQIDAAIGLRKFTDLASESALLHAVEDNAFLVRYHACESLLYRWQITPSGISAHPEISKLIGMLGSTPESRKEATARLELLREKDG